MILSFERVTRHRLGALPRVLPDQVLGALPRVLPDQVLGQFSSSQ